jgi:hypothetical protein
MNQRGSDRRRPPGIEMDVSYLKYVIARAQH